MKSLAKLLVAGFFFYIYTTANGNQRIGDFKTQGACVEAVTSAQTAESTLPGFQLLLAPNSYHGPVVCFQD